MFCLATGVVLDTALAALTTSEQALCSQLLLQAQSWANWVLVLDRNFGVYSVARSAQQAGAHLVSRMTQARAAKMARLAGASLAPGLDVRVTWQPGKHDRCPEAWERKPVEGRLVVMAVRRAGRSLRLYLFTTLLDSNKYTPQALAELYGQRWQVELYFRYVKAQMDRDFCNAARRKWRARSGWPAWPLIISSAIPWPQRPPWPRCPCASFPLAERANCSRLGCSGLRCAPPTQRSWKILLSRMAKAQLPKRKKPRPSEPRAVRPFRKDHATLVGSRAEARKRLSQPQAES